MKKNNKRGFTLVECLVALALFALMTVIVSGILSIALKEYKKNNENQQNLNLQEKDLVEDNASVQEVANIATLQIPFDGVTIEVDNVSNKASDNQNGLQLNKLVATIAKESNGSGGGGSSVTPDIKTASPHLYGTKGLDKVSVTGTSFDPSKTSDTIILTLRVTDSENLLTTAGNSIKVVLPKGAYNVVPYTSFGRWDYTTDDYDELDTEKDSTHIRFTQCAGATIQIKFDITKTDYDTNYGSLYKYFVDKDSTDTITNNAVLSDEILGKKTGYYNTVTI